MNLRKLSVLLAGLATLLFADQASATAIYSYSGNNFTSATAPYTTAMRVTATFSLTSELAANLFEVDLIPSVLSFTMADGIAVYDVATSPFSSLVVSTDGAGNLFQWDAVLTDAAFDGACTRSDVIHVALACNAGPNDAASNSGGSASVFSSGTWTLIPEPSTALLLSSGLLGLAARGRRRKA